MKLIAQVGSLDLNEAIELGKYATELGYDALSAVTPFYYLFIFYLIIMIILQFFVNSDDATKVNLSQTFEPISWTHLLGTDDYGRDLFTRVIVGARSTLFITILTLIAIVIIGVTLGLLAGYKRMDRAHYITHC